MLNALSLQVSIDFFYQLNSLMLWQYIFVLSQKSFFLANELLLLRNFFIS